MRKVINGKLYDTDTANEIASDSYLYASAFSHWVETLYQTRNGSWFLVGEGGPSSRYSVSVGHNQWGGGSQIIPLSKAKALAWLEEHAGVDVVLEHFGSQVVEA